MSLYRDGRTDATALLFAILSSYTHVLAGLVFPLLSMRLMAAMQPVWLHSVDLADKLSVSSIIFGPPATTELTSYQT
jgi:hypothetical protein